MLYRVQIPLFCVAAALPLLVCAGCSNGGGASSGAERSSVVVDSNSNPWFRAAATNSDADLAAAVSSGADVNVHERHDRNTPLHVAAIAGNDKAVQFILAHGGQVDAVDEDGRTALTMACHNS